MNAPLLERYRDRIAGVLTCYDRIVITGTLPGACYADGMTSFLNAKHIRIFDSVWVDVSKADLATRALRERVQPRRCKQSSHLEDCRGGASTEPFPGGQPT